MKPRLATVLSLRRAAEDAVRREIGRLERERAAAVAIRARIAADLSAAAASPVAIGLREQLASFADAMRALLHDADAALAAQDGRIDAARTALAAAHREVRAIEALQQRDAAAAAERQRRRMRRDEDEHAARLRLVQEATA